MEEGAGDMDIQWDLVLVRAVKLRDAVLPNVLAQCDGSEDLEVVRMRLLKLIFELIKIDLCVVRITFLDEIEIRIHKGWPEELAKLELHSVSYHAAYKKNRRPLTYLVDVEILLDPVPQELEGLGVLLGTQILRPDVDWLAVGP